MYKKIKKKDFVHTFLKNTEIAENSKLPQYI